VFIKTEKELLKKKKKNRVLKMIPADFIWLIAARWGSRTIHAHKTAHQWMRLPFSAARVCKRKEAVIDGATTNHTIISRPRISRPQHSKEPTSRHQELTSNSVKC
jgi:hypothetical protein